jgi:exodeoxyribonuclease V alpha subunit
MSRLDTTIEGHIERITFKSDENHFMIARFCVTEQNARVTVLGHMPEPRPGETLRLHGSWQCHPRFGEQFKVESFEILLPAGVEQIRRYLCSGLIPGIGAKTGERLINHFKEETLSIIENEPQRLADVRGIGEAKARQIHQAWQAHHAVRALMQFLQENGVKPAYGARIYKTYGTDALEILQSNPYQVAADLPRIGFQIADAIVRHSGLPIDEEERAAACVHYVLETACDDGHMYMERDQLIEQCSNWFELDYHALEQALEFLADDRRIALDPQAPGKPVYLYALYRAEMDIARRLQAVQTIPAPVQTVDSSRIMETIVRRLAIALSETQLTILQRVLHNRMVIITGGPGTGKTTLIRSLAAVFEAMGNDYLLAAPTGRAARRLAEVTGRNAVTLHKLLGYNLADGCFERNADNPLETDALIVDEASMVDTLLMGHLIRAMPVQARLILVGDVFQLPSVGPGTVLADLIASGRFETFELKEIFRQAAQSPIILNAHKVRHGEIPELHPKSSKTEEVADPVSFDEFTFLEENDPAAIVDRIVELSARGLPDQLGLDGIRDVQVLTPMHKGPVGTLNLNTRLQKELNPGKGGLKSIGATFRPGDKVMQLRNNYQKEVFNGEIGIASEIEADQGRLAVAFDGRQVTYELAELDELSLAYAISVHKSQGSEYPVVIVPMVTQHYVMLQRNLLYTALTRAQRMVILVGSVKAVRIAVQADSPRQRRSLLAWRCAHP